MEELGAEFQAARERYLQAHLAARFARQCEVGAKVREIRDVEAEAEARRCLARMRVAGLRSILLNPELWPEYYKAYTEMQYFTSSSLFTVRHSRHKLDEKQVRAYLLLSKEELEAVFTFCFAHDPIEVEPVSFKFTFQRTVPDQPSESELRFDTELCTLQAHVPNLNVLRWNNQSESHYSITLERSPSQFFSVFAFFNK
jgi:hypothetical protein